MTTAAPNGRNLTIVDIARAASVSRSTVSLVLKGSPLVREETGERVTKAMDALGYVYNREAANLRRARSGIVGMVINDLFNPFFAELAIGIERALQNSGFVRSWPTRPRASCGRPRSCARCASTAPPASS
jgi:LacI family transcriptional regulator